MRRAAVAVALIAAATVIGVVVMSAYVTLGHEPGGMPDISESSPSMPVTTMTPGHEPGGMPDIETQAQPRDAATANNEFAVKFYKNLPVGENTFFSPTSMYVAFSALYEGARGNTAAQMQDVFGLDPNDETRHNSTADVMASINRDDPDAILEVANALWIADWFTPSQSYLDVARGTYLATVETVNFVGDDTVDKINQWASDKTRGKIKEVITPGAVDGSTAMVINNAMYFKGTWVQQFPKPDTRESDFWTGDTRSVKTDFMNVEGSFEYVRSDGAQVLKMPYRGGGLSMLVILPDERGGLAELTEALSAEQISKWSANLQRSEVSVSMPKFEMGRSYGLKPILMGMGMTDAFISELANLRGIGQGSGGLFVAKALHDTYINVDELGTEATAVTTIIIEQSGPPPSILRFEANHPFLFAIQDDETGMILFMGSIADPTSSGLH